MSYNEENKTECGNCGSWLGPEDHYCVKCGTKRGIGQYVPDMRPMVCIYGPPPVERRKRCTECGHEWSFYSMTDNQKYCPKCGASAVLVYEEEPYF